MVLKPHPDGDRCPFPWFPWFPSGPDGGRCQFPSSQATLIVIGASFLSSQAALRVTDAHSLILSGSHTVPMTGASSLVSRLS